MSRRFEMREVGTGRVLGAVETTEEHAAGELLRLFLGGTVQLEVADLGPAEPEATAAVGASKKRKGQR